MTIAQLNGIKNPNALAVGKELTIPRVSHMADVNTYVVQDGDTLWAIAEEKFGDANRLAALVEGNSLPNGANKIYPGMAIQLPEN